MAPRFRKSLPERARRARLAAVRRDAGQRREAKRRIAEARMKTGDFIARLMMTYSGFTVFCVFALLSPDRLMIDAQASVSMPVAGTVSFLAFMVVAPVVLIGMRFYLEIYVQHWRQLDAELDPETEPKTLSPLKHQHLWPFSAVVFYPLLPVMLALFTWKVAAKDIWGEVFLLLTVVCVAAQAYQFVPRPWSRRAAHIAAVLGSLFVFLLVGVLYEWGFPHRGLDLAREDLKAAYLPGQDLRDAVLVQANLAAVDLTFANLTDARLTSAILTDADLSVANLTDANLTGADLTDAFIMVANLTGADLTDAKLTNANLVATNLTNANLTRADLTGAELGIANLTFANLGGAKLENAVLKNANLMGANLMGTTITQEQLDSACIIEGGTPPALPKGLKPPHKVCGPGIR